MRVSLDAVACPNLLRGKSRASRFTGGRLLFLGQEGFEEIHAACGRAYSRGLPDRGFFHTQRIGRPCRYMLPGTSLKSKSSFVESELEQLIMRLRRVTNRKGAKADLAKLLGVNQARVSEWLSGRKEPGGATTLKLLKWVENQECQS